MPDADEGRSLGLTGNDGMRRPRLPHALDELGEVDGRSLSSPATTTLCSAKSRTRWLRRGSFRRRREPAIRRAEFVTVRRLGCPACPTPVNTLHDYVYPPVVAGLLLRSKLLGLKLRVEGAHHVPRSGPAVMASNHISHLDFIFVGLGARQSRRYVRFMAKESIFANRIAGPLMRGMHHISVDRSAGMQSFRDAMAALKDGEIVGLVP